MNRMLFSTAVVLCLLLETIGAVRYTYTLAECKSTWTYAGKQYNDCTTEILGMEWCLVEGIATPQICAPAPEVPSTMFPPDTSSPTATSISLTWETPTITLSEQFTPGGQQIINYNVSYAVNTGEFENHFLVDGSLTSYTLTGLEHATTYTFKVGAINAQGAGGQSDADELSAATTLGEPDAPAVPIITGITKTSLTVQWTAPYDHADPIRYYQLYLDESVGLRWERFHAIATTALDVASTFESASSVVDVLGGSLQTPTDYDDDYSQKITGYFYPTQNGGHTFQIACRGACQLYLSTDAARGNKVLLAEVKEGESVTEGDFTARSSVSVTLSATSVYYLEVLHSAGSGTDYLAAGVVLPDGSSSQPIEESFLQYVRPNATSFIDLVQNHSSGQNTYSATVDDLRFGQHYRFHVAAKNDVGWSPISNSSALTTTGAEKPVMPEMPTVDGATTGSLTVNWIAPIDNGAEISGYAVRGRETGAIDWDLSLSATVGAVHSHTVTGLLPGTAYEFQINAQNEHGSTSYTGTSVPAETLPTVPNPPAAPFTNNFAASLDVPTNLASAQVVVNWVPSRDNGLPITKYALYIKHITAATDWAFVTETSDLNHLVAGLTAGDKYQFMVAVANSLGYSGNSTQSSTATMLPTIPSAPVAPTTSGHVAYLDIGTNLATAHVTVSWVPPNSNGADVLSYVVKTKRVGVDSEFLLPVVVQHNTSLTTQSVTIFNLLPGEQYDFNVYASNDEGDSPRSPGSTTTTMLTTKPSAPVQPTTGSLTASLNEDTNIALATVTVSWTAPNFNGDPITNYRIKQRHVDGDWTEFVFSNVTEAVMYDLLPGESYEFSVIAVNTQGNSSASPISASVKMLATRPSAPQPPTLSNAQLHSIDLDWEAPEKNGEPVIGYRIVLRDVEAISGLSGFATYLPINKVGQKNYTWGGLIGSTMYQFKVAAINAIGESPFSNASIEYPTADAPPSATLPPRLYNPTRTSLTASWLAPLENGAAITDYFVHFQGQPNDPGIKVPEYSLKMTDNVLETTLTGLNEGTTYHVYVAANNSRGEGESSNITILSTLKDPALDPCSVAETADCSPCASKANCGWCASRGACLSGYANGPFPNFDCPDWRFERAACPTGITLSHPRLFLSEGKGMTHPTSTTYEIALRSEPTSLVQIQITHSTDVAVSPLEVDFTATDWDTPKTVTVTAVNDETDEAIRETHFITHFAISKDPLYTGNSSHIPYLPGSEVELYIEDNDNAVVRISESLVNVNEGSNFSAYYVVLGSSPIKSVTITLESSSADLTVSPEEIIFTTSNWATGQAVQVASIEGTVPAGDSASFTITHTADSADRFYSTKEVVFAPADAEVDVRAFDSTSPAAIISPASSSITEASGVAGSYSIALTRAPTADVTVDVVGFLRFTPSPSTLVFTASDFSVAQTVQLNTDDDDVARGVITSLLKHDFKSDDPFYDRSSSTGDPLPSSSLSITRVDKDTASVTASESALLVTENGVGADSPSQTYTISLTSEPLSNVYVGIAADPTGDISLSTDTVVFTSGNWSTPATVTVTAITDDLQEGDESMKLVHTVTSADAKFNEFAAADVNVTVQDSAGTVAFSKPSVTVLDHVGKVVLTVKRTAGTRGQIHVIYTTEDGTATAGIDYTLTAGTLTIEDGIAEATIDVPIKDDYDYEDTSPTFSMKILSVSAGATMGAQNNMTVYMSDDSTAGALSFTNSDFAVDEITGIAKVTVTRVGGKNGAVAVDYSAYNETVTITTGTLTFDDGADIGTIAFDTNDGTLFGYLHPKFKVELVATTGGADIATPKDSLVTIIECTNLAECGVVRFSNSSYTVSEGNATATLNVTLIGGNSSAAGFKFSVGKKVYAGDTATSSDDFDCKDGVLDSSKSGHCYMLVRSPKLWDVAVKHCKDWGGMLVSITSAYENDFVAALLSKPTYIGAVKGEDEEWKDQTGAKADVDGSLPWGTGFPRKRSGSDYATLDSSGNWGTTALDSLPYVCEKEGADYASATGTVSFDGASSALLEVKLHNDAVYESVDETFTVEIMDALGGAVLGSVDKATVTIEDDGDAGVIAFSQTAVTVLETVGEAQLTVTRTGGYSGDVSVTYSTTDGSAVGGGNKTYDFLSTIETSVTLASGARRVLIPIKIWQDGEFEPDNENFTVDIVSVDGGAQLGSSNLKMTVTIEDTDEPCPTETADVCSGHGVCTDSVCDCSVGFAGVACLPVGTLSFQQATQDIAENKNEVVLVVQRTGGDAGMISATYTTADGTASAVDDFEDTVGVIEFSDTETSKTISIPLVNDTLYEAPDETFTVTLSAPTGGAAIGSQDATTVTILDDGDAGTFDFTAASFSGSEDSGTIGVTITRVGGSSTSVSVKYSTSDASATGADYTSVTLGELVFAEGVTELVASISITNDTTYEAAETFGVSLVEATGGALIGSLNATEVTITDDGDAGTFEFSSSSYSGSEDSGAIAVTITRLGGESASTSVKYSTSQGTELLTSGFTGATARYHDVGFAGSTNKQVDFAEGVQEQVVMIPIFNDTIFQNPDEMFTVTLSDPLGGALIGAQSSTVVTILDDGDAGTFEFSSSGYSVSEDAGAVTVTILRVGGDSTVGSGVSVLLTTTTGTATSDGSAEGDVDFKMIKKVISFADGDTSKEVALDVKDDALFEDTDETFTVTLSAPTGGAAIGSQDATTVTILDDGDAGTFDFTAASFSGSEDSGTIGVTITRVGGSSTSVSVKYSTSAASATGADYTSVTLGELVFAEGVTELVASISITNDTTYEAAETFGVSLVEATGGALIGSLNATEVTITDDGDAGTFEFSSSSYSGSEDSGAIAVTITRLGGESASTSVKYSTRFDLTSASSDDFTSATNKQVDFAEGVQEQVVMIPIFNDTIFESPDEVFIVTLSDPLGGALIGAQSSANVTILDDGDAGTFEFSSSGYSVSEDAGAVTVTILRVGGSSTAVSAKCTIENTSPLLVGFGAGANKVAKIVEFAHHDTQKTVIIPFVNNSVYVASETFKVVLSDATGGSHVGTLKTTAVSVLDDGDAGTFAFSASSYEGREDDGVVVLTVTRLGGDSGETSVSFSTSAGTTNSATEMTDYDKFTDKVVIFAHGETSKTISIPLVNDTLYEAPDETFTVTLSAPTGGAAIGSQDATTVTILDDGDAGTFDFTAASFSGSEDSGTIGVTITRVGGSSTSVSVKYSTSDASATGADYTSVTLGELVFAEGVTELVASISITNDTTYEAAETFGVSLVEATGGALIGSLNATEVTITDDGDAGTFEFSSSSYSGSEESGAITVTVSRLGGDSTVGDAVTVNVHTADDTAIAYTNFGSALKFEGSAEWVRIGSDEFTSQLTDAATWETWIKLESYPTFGNLISKFLWAPLDGYRITLREGTLSFFSACGARSLDDCSDSESLTKASIALPLGAWHHIAVVKDGATVFMFMDGEELSYTSRGSHGDLQLSDAMLEFGHMQGEVDEFRIWSTAKDAAAIQARLFKALHGAEAGILMYWDFNYMGVIRGEYGSHGISNDDWVASTVPQDAANFDQYGDGSILVGDYEVFNQTLSFADGVTELTVEIKVIDDALYDPNEAFTVLLASPTGGAAVGMVSTASVEILDDGDAGTFEFSSSTFEGTEDAGVLLVTVTRLGGSRNATSVSYSTSDGTASAVDDFEDTVGVIEFSDTETSKTISIPLVNDTLYEAPDETFTVTLSAPTGGAAIGSQDATTVTILDDGDAGTFDFTAASFSGSEDSGTIGVTITRVGGSSTSVSVKYSTSDASATGADYTSVTLGELVFAEGVTELVASISITNDTTYEAAETFGVSLVEATGGALIGSLNATEVTITDDGDAGTFIFGTTTFTVQEDVGSFVIPISRVGGADGPAVVMFSTIAGSADKEDYIEASNSIVEFSHLQTTANAVLAIRNDTLFELEENFTVKLTMSSDNTTLGKEAETSATVTITDDGDFGLFKFTSSSYSIVETNGFVVLTVSRIGGSSGEATVYFSTADDDSSSAPATSGQDYQNVHLGQVKFMDGQSEAEFEVGIFDDAEYKAEEYFQVLLSDGSSHIVQSISDELNATTVTILDDGDAGTFDFTAASFSGSEDSGTIGVTITRVGGSSTSVSVKYSTSDASATGADYTSVTLGELVFAEGVTELVASISITNDTTYEAAETFGVSLVEATGGALIGSLNATEVTITDDGDAGTFEFSSSSYSGSEDSGAIAVTITRLGGKSGKVTIEYQTEDDTAVATGGDYVTSSGCLTFEDGETSQTVLIKVLNDTVYETPDESFTVLLGNPTDGSLLNEAGANTSVTIVDDGDAGTFSFTQPVFVIGEDRGHVEISVSRLGGSSTTVTVGYYTQDGNATAESDYNAVDGVLIFGEGEDTKTFNVLIVDDIEYEHPNEYFTVNLKAATDGSSLGGVSAQVSINDERDVEECDQHKTKEDCSGTGPGGVCCIWVTTQINGTGVCTKTVANGFSEMLCRPRLPK